MCTGCLEAIRHLGNIEFFHTIDFNGFETLFFDRTRKNHNDLGEQFAYGSVVTQFVIVDKKTLLNDISENGISFF